MFHRVVPPQFAPHARRALVSQRGELHICTFYTVNVFLKSKASDKRILCSKRTPPQKSKKIPSRRGGRPLHFSPAPNHSTPDPPATIHSFHPSLSPSPSLTRTRTYRPSVKTPSSPNNFLHPFLLRSGWGKKNTFLFFLHQFSLTLACVDDWTFRTTAVPQNAPQNAPQHPIETRRRHVIITILFTHACTHA